MPNIFVSYRRDDTEVLTGRLCDRLKDRFGRDSVFVDIDNIPPGTDFRQHIQATLADCQVLLAVIGDKWLGPRTGAPDRIQDSTDWVRLELEFALSQDMYVIPVLSGTATMPREDQLPASLRHLPFRNAARLDTGRDFHHHVNELIRTIEHQLGIKSSDAPQYPSENLVYRTSKQQTYLRVTARGLECHMYDDRPSKAGHQWTISKSQAAQILRENQVTVTPNYTTHSGLFTVGERRDWLYSMKLFPEPKMLEETLKQLLSDAAT